MKPIASIRILAFLLFSATVVLAEDGPKRVKYVAPDGFAEFRWGDLRSKFTRLPESPIGVGAAWMARKEKPQEFTCITTMTMGPTGGLDGCDINVTLQQARKSFDGGGTYVLSEYSLEGQGFRFGDADPVTLYPVVFQFCANWSGGKGKRMDLPQNFDDLNKFCGVRLLFDSETREQLRSLPADHVTNYDRVLKKLLAKFGRPDGFMKRGRVVIETLDGDSDNPSERRFSIWRWCPALDRGLKTECTASVTLSLDPTTGKGSVLYSTPLLWEYAYARENFGFKGDRLFKLLHARN
jgi:hypothetical protein